MSILDHFKISAKKANAPKSLGRQIIDVTPDERQEDSVVREPTPSTTNAVLDTVINGPLTDQGVLFESMFDTWPRLQGNVDEICGLVSCNEIQVEPFTEDGQDPTPSAIEKAEFVKQALAGMQSDNIHGMNDIEGTVYALAQSYYQGHSVQEIIWQRSADGITPKSTFTLPWRYFAYPDRTNTEDRLMLNPHGDYSLNNLKDFPSDKFIVGIKKGHTGHASQAAPLRSLVTYWLGTVYGNKWLLNYAQLYGIPLRWATYPKGDSKSRSAAANMLRKMGSQVWGAFETGTKIEVKEASTSAGNLPQQALIDNANKACDIFVLGQTLTSDVSSTGSQALGNVHNDIRLDVADRVGKYCAKVISSDLVEPLLTLNYPDGSEMPTISIKSKRAKDAKGLAETAKILRETFPEIPISEEHIRETHDMPKPMNDEDAIVKEAQTEEAPEELEIEEEKETVEASQAKIKAAANKENVEKLSDSVLESLTGVAAEYLGGVKPDFMRLAALASSGQVSDDDYLEVVKAAKNQIPELFDKLDTESLQKAFEESGGTAMIAGVEKSLED